MIPSEKLLSLPSFHASKHFFVYEDGLIFDPVITKMVSERYRHPLPPPRSRRQPPPLFPVLFDPLCYLMTHSILRHLLKLSKLEKKFSPLPPLRKPPQEISTSEIEISDSDEEESDSESEIDEDPVQNRYLNYQIQIHRTVSFVRRRRSSLQRRFSSFKYLKLEDEVLFSLENSSADEEERDSELPQQVSPQASSINFFAEPQQPLTKPFKPKIEGSTVKVGEIICSLLAFRSSSNQHTNGGSPICNTMLVQDSEEEEITVPPWMFLNTAMTIEERVKKSLESHFSHLASEITEESKEFIADLVKKLDTMDQEPIPDLKCSNISEIVPSVFDLHQVNYGTDRNISFAKSRGPSEIKKNDTSTGSKFFNDLMFFESDLVSLCLDSENRVTVESDFVFSDLHGAGINTFDPGGPPIAVESHIQFFGHPGVWIAVFDPGGNRRQPPSVSSNHSNHSLVCSRSFLPSVVYALLFSHLVFGFCNTEERDRVWLLLESSRDGFSFSHVYGTRYRLGLLLFVLGLDHSQPSWLIGLFQRIHHNIGLGCIT